MLNIYVSLMKNYPEIGSELNELGSMVHISFVVIDHSDYTTGTPLLVFWYEIFHFSAIFAGGK